MFIMLALPRSIPRHCRVATRSKPHTREIRWRVTMLMFVLPRVRITNRLSSERRARWSRHYATLMPIRQAMIACRVTRRRAQRASAICAMRYARLRRCRDVLRYGF